MDRPKPLLDQAGGCDAVAEMLGISPARVRKWSQRRVPAEWVPRVAEATKIPAHEWRPDVFPAEEQRA